MIAVEVEIEAGDWSALGDASALARDVAVSVSASLPNAVDEAEVALLLTGDAEVRALNRDLRGIDEPTNVLSFPSPSMPGGPHLLGDIALACETVAREARQEGKTMRDHAAHLVAHGLLHLLGHDHGSDEEADRMERLEAAILARLGIADPFAVPA